MAIKILRHTRVEKLEIEYSDWSEVTKMEKEGWTAEPQDSCRYVTLERELPTDPVGFRVTAFWPDGGESGHDTFATFVHTKDWRTALLATVEEMNESHKFEEGAEIEFDDIVASGEIDTAKDADRHAVVVWKNGEAQFKEDQRL